MGEGELGMWIPGMGDNKTRPRKLFKEYGAKEMPALK
jgi:hypothetical protein